MISEFIRGLRTMIGLEGRLNYQENPEGIYDAKVPMHNKLDYELLVKILKTDTRISCYEKITGIVIPEKYKEGISPQYSACK